MVSSRPVVLIVDDEEATRDLVCEELTEVGYVSDVASNADDALVKLKTYNFDLALLDIKLPGMSGMDLLKIIRECYRMIKIVMMTGVDDLDTAVEAMKLGASDYIVKPFTYEKLIVSINTVLKNKKPHCAVYHTIPGIEDMDYNKNAKSRSLREINAIAYGVDAQVDYFDLHSRIVTDRTVELARRLSLPRRAIKEWAATRDQLYYERDRRIKSMLNKLERNVMAQLILGFTHSMCPFPKSSGGEN